MVFKSLKVQRLKILKTIVLGINLGGILLLYICLDSQAS